MKRITLLLSVVLLLSGGCILLESPTERTQSVGEDAVSLDAGDVEGDGDDVSPDTSPTPDVADGSDDTDDTGPDGDDRCPHPQEQRFVESLDRCVTPCQEEESCTQAEGNDGPEAECEDFEDDEVSTCRCPDEGYRYDHEDGCSPCTDQDDDGHYLDERCGPIDCDDENDAIHGAGSSGLTSVAISPEGDGSCSEPRDQKEDSFEIGNSKPLYFNFGFHYAGTMENNERFLIPAIGRGEDFGKSLTTLPGLVPGATASGSSLDGCMPIEDKEMCDSSSEPCTELALTTNKLVDGDYFAFLVPVRASTCVEAQERVANHETRFIEEPRLIGRGTVTREMSDCESDRSYGFITELLIDDERPLSTSTIGAGETFPINGKGDFQKPPEDASWIFFPAEELEVFVGLYYDGKLQGILRVGEVEDSDEKCTSDALTSAEFSSGNGGMFTAPDTPGNYRVSARIVAANDQSNARTKLESKNIPFSTKVGVLTVK